MRRKKEQKKKESTTVSEFKIDFSFRREVFFIIAGALMGAISYVIPITVFAIEGGSSYYLTWIVFGHIAGVYSPITSVIIAGFMLHILTATSIGIISGLFLYKTNILNISKPSNGLKYGLFVGSLVFAIFAIPVQEFVLGPEYSRTLGSSSSTTTTTTTTANKSSPAVTENSQPMLSKPSIFSNQITFNQLRAIIDSLIINLTFGITLGLFSSFLSSKFGARYRCPKCDISFSRVDSLQHHLELIHGSKPIHPKRILILGGGFAGVEVLRRLQSKFQTNVGIEITMVSKDNYMLFTPMLHEVASGMIETRHIVTPIRAFCNRSRFYSAIVEDIDLKNKRVIIRSSATTPLGNTDRSTVEHDILELKNTRSLYYDYLVIALGSETKFFGMSDVQQNAFTMKSLNDAINLRNHIVYLLEQSDQLPSNYATTDTSSNNTYKDLQKRLLTFVIVGGGFAGVETAGEINDFIKDSAKDYYHNIDSNNIRTIIIQSGNRLLPEMSEELAEFALQKLRNSGVEVILNTRVVGATANSVKLSNGTIIPTKTLIWSGGVSPNTLITNLTCEHDKSGRIVVDKYLEVPQFKGVYALGDCAYITDPYTGKPCPPTAQHAIREGAVVAKNIISTIADEKRLDEREAFNYKTKGMMASIGKRTGIGNLLGIEVQGFLAWWIWRNYYLVNLPTLQKKIRVMSDWMLDIFFKRDVTMLKTFVEEKEKEDIKTNTSSI
jgi:NADH dehydrogenase FAD-containing subunit